MSDYVLFAVGEESPIRMEREGCQFDITENGPILVCALNRPTQKELRSFSSRSPFHIRFIRLGGILFLLFKFGDLPWMDVPYDIRLSPSAVLPDFNPGEGFALNVVFVDSSTNIIKELRMIGLGEKFSRALKAEILATPQEGLFLPQYYAQIDRIYRVYSSEKLAKMASNYYKLPGAE